MDEFEVEYLFSDCNNQFEIAMKFLDLSQSPETCVTLRHSGCIPLIVQIIHSDVNEITKNCAFIALQNIVGGHPDDKVVQAEATVLKHIESIVKSSNSIKKCYTQNESLVDNSIGYPLKEMNSLRELSFDENHRKAMYEFGALQAIANLVIVDQALHGHSSKDEHCMSLRKYAYMALTRLTSGSNVTLLNSNREFMKSLVSQLNSDSDDLLQVTATLLKNLLFRIDHGLLRILHESGTITELTKAAMKSQNEKTLQILLRLLLILSAYDIASKAEICGVNGALDFLIDMIVSTKSLSLMEIASGILRRVACCIAGNKNYRQILRERNCLKTLLQLLSSESLTVVGNACGTLWNLSVGCPEDQKFLCDHKAVFMLSLLTDSKHKSISDGSRAALKNLLNFRPDDYRFISNYKSSSSNTVTKSIQLKELPSLNLRKQRTLVEDLKTNFLLLSSSPLNGEGTISSSFVPLNDNDNPPRSSKVVDLNAIAKSTSVPTRFVSLKGSVTIIRTSTIVIKDSEKFYLTKGSSYIHRVFVVSKESVVSNLGISSDQMVTESGTDPPDKPSKFCEES